MRAIVPSPAQRAARWRLPYKLSVSVHSATCPNVVNLLYDPERQIDVAWAGEKGAFYAIELDVVTDDRPGLLADLTQAIAGEGSNIRRIEARLAIQAGSKSGPMRGYATAAERHAKAVRLQVPLQAVDGGVDVTV